MMTLQFLSMNFIFLLPYFYFIFCFRIFISKMDFHNILGLGELIRISLCYNNQLDIFGPPGTLIFLFYQSFETNTILLL